MIDFSTSAVTRTARKPHQYTWCPEMILPGEKYETWVGSSAGDFYVAHMHIECVMAATSDRDILDDGFDEHTFRRGSLEEATSEDRERCKRQREGLSLQLGNALDAFSASRRVNIGQSASGGIL